MEGTWYYLPAEIRAMILEEIARQRHCGWASFAAVSREWQAVLEPKNFLALKLRISCLEDMEHMVNRSAHLVRRVWLHIELPRYSCRNCTTKESRYWSDRNNTVVKGAIVKMFSIISSWKPRDRLVLELSAYTRSDMEHKFNPRAFEPGYHYHDPKHDWYNGRQRWLDDSDIRRLFSLFLNRPPEELLEVPAVTDLVMRRQSMGAEVKTISILEDFNEDVQTALALSGAVLAHEEFLFPRELVGALALRSCSLEHLSVSYMLCARVFYEECQPTYKWERLQSLALTTPSLIPTGNGGLIQELLLTAGRVALRMPKLQDLALWNGKRGEACAFIYHKGRQSQDEASLTWRGTWDFSLDGVAEWWQKNLGPVKVKVKYEQLQKEIIHSHGDAIHHLRLPRGVIDPESLRQIRQEGMLGGAAAFHGVIAEAAELSTAHGEAVILSA
ncbi:unnamed protein product [Clonostachys byssicola]|uniref:DUF6546 domain-containing protein n=1 Tax=Clonostachys byssicola TaxID=160290 RepID=A0A9N9UJ73_9HYPO|nr:unnamed protein product [Clonostachys byssicola]